MAQASKRSAFLRPVMYDDDDEPSSISMSLELFGYHNGGDEAADGSGSASALSLQLAFDDDSFVKGGCECDDAGGGASAADYYYYGSWAGAYGGSGATSSGSNSSVLSFEQAGSGGGQRHHLVYGEDGCALWMDDAGAGMVVEHPPPAQQQQQHGSGCDFGLIGSSPDDAGLHIQLEPGTVQLPAKAPPHKRARRVRN